MARPTNRPSNRPSDAAIVALVGLVVAVLAGLIVGAVLLGRSGDEPSADATSEPTEPTTEPTPTTGSPTSEPTTTAPVVPPGPSADEVADQFLSAVLRSDCMVVDGLSSDDFVDREGGCEVADLDDLDLYTFDLEPLGQSEEEASYVGLLTRPDDSTAPVITFRLRLVPTEVGWRVEDLEEQG